jgi:site-specific DNA-cytosine methylase
MLAYDLFCGGGGVGLALKRCGLTPIGFDNDEVAIRIYRQAAGEAILADVRTLCPKTLRGALLIWASPPCPPWSEAVRFRGARWGLQHPDGDLLFLAAELIRDAHPAVGIVENVGGIPDAPVGRVVEILEGAGYVVTVLRQNARAWVPQNRDHVFIIAASGWVPAPGSSRAPRFATIEDGRGAHPVSLSELRRAMGKDIYRTPIVGPDDILPTVTTRPYSERQSCFVMTRPGYLRYPTFVEAARAQGFPDDHPVHELHAESPTKAWRIVGNAVPIPLAEAVIRSALSRLAA